MISNDGNPSGTVIPAAAGWELITITFDKGLNCPEVHRDPVIGWRVTDTHTYPVMPRASYDEPLDMETEYNAYLCPDGTVVGGIYRPRSADLQSFVDTCVETEWYCLNFESMSFRAGEASKSRRKEAGTKIMRKRLRVIDGGKKDHT